MFEYLKREKDAFELFKEAYRKSFPAGPPPPHTELNILTPRLVAGVGAESASVSLLFATLDEALFASSEEGRFAEIEWL